MRETYYRLLYKKGEFTQQQVEEGSLERTGADPRDLGNWRPIGLLCCDFKILSSHMANSLKPHMDSIVPPNATTFIPGRVIHDNIMLAQLMIHYHDTENEGAGLLGIDFGQAYTYLS